MNRAVFIDRDGTINRDEGHTHKVKDFELMPNVVPALQKLSKSDYKIIVVTNQAGIGRRYYTEGDMCAFHEHMCGHLKKRACILTPYTTARTTPMMGVNVESQKPA
jgi:D-glycero-D-manno-heptose 1,7-bisphosphate phosphatase